VSLGVCRLHYAAKAAFKPSKKLNYNSVNIFLMLWLPQSQTVRELNPKSCISYASLVYSSTSFVSIFPRFSLQLLAMGHYKHGVTYISPRVVIQPTDHDRLQYVTMQGWHYFAWLIRLWRWTRNVSPHSKENTSHYRTLPNQCWKNLKFYSILNGNAASVTALPCHLPSH
jgi:hypothetical protein